MVYCTVSIRVVASRKGEVMIAKVKSIGELRMKAREDKNYEKASTACS